MLPNPFVALWESPVATLTQAAYALVLLGFVVLTWWAAGRNYLYLEGQWQEGWQVLVPARYALRAFAMLVILAVDCLLVAGIVAVLK